MPLISHSASKNSSVNWHSGEQGVNGPNVLDISDVIQLPNMLFAEIETLLPLAGRVVLITSPDTAVTTVPPTFNWIGMVSMVLVTATFMV